MNDGPTAPEVVLTYFGCVEPAGHSWVWSETWEVWECRHSCGAVDAPTRPEPSP